MLPVILLDMVGWGLAFCPMVTSTNARPPSMWTCERFWGPHNILPWVFASSFQQGCRDNWQWTFGTMDCKTVETTWISLRRTMECFYSVGKRICSKANCIIVIGFMVHVAGYTYIEPITCVSYFHFSVYLEFRGLIFNFSRPRWLETGLAPRMR